MNIIIKNVEMVNRMEYKCSLSRIALHNSAKICEIECSKSLKNRLYDLGILEDAVITPIFESTFGDPTAYLIKNAVIALRRKDCENIIVYPL